jgi:hypothetical protein
MRRWMLWRIATNHDHEMDAEDDSKSFIEYKEMNDDEDIQENGVSKSQKKILKAQELLLRCIASIPSIPSILQWQVSVN